MVADYDLGRRAHARPRGSPASDLVNPCTLIAPPRLAEEFCGPRRGRRPMSLTSRPPLVSACPYPRHPQAG